MELVVDFRVYHNNWLERQYDTRWFGGGTKLMGMVFWPQIPSSDFDIVCGSYNCFG